MATHEERLALLDQQQTLLTDCLADMLINRWVGFPSLQANLEALSPGIQLEAHPPLVESEAGPPAPPPPFMANYRPDTYMAPQLRDWTCSCCSLDWVLEATGTRGSDRERTTLEVGYTENVNETYGLMDGSGSQLRRVLADYGLNSYQGWLTFDQVWALAGKTTGMMSGGAWYHWVAIRGQDGGNIWIANSACGYKNVWESLSRDDFARLGPFSVVVLAP